MSDFETIDYRVENQVGHVTLNRPDQYNAFTFQMADELQSLWRALREDDSVNCVLLTGAGEKAFCTGMDRSEMPAAEGEPPPFDPFSYSDPGDQLGPKSNQLWKPVVAAVNGMACGGAFYLLGESDVIVAAESATFFDPHLNYGMAAVYEPIQMMSKMPFGEVLRMTLLGNYERLSAERAREIGLVSEVVPDADLATQATWVAESIAAQPGVATQTTVRALWAARELSRLQAISLGNELLTPGVSAKALRQGQELFASGVRAEWRLR